MKTIQTKITYDLYDVMLIIHTFVYKIFLQKRERKHIAACFIAKVTN